MWDCELKVISILAAILGLRRQLLSPCKQLKPEGSWSWKGLSKC